MNKLKLKLLSASLVIVELVREKEKLVSIVKTLVSHMGGSPHLENSTPARPSHQPVHTAQQDHTPHPAHLTPVKEEESETERSELSARPPPSGRLSSNGQQRGVRFKGPPLGEGGGRRDGKETPLVEEEGWQDVEDGEQRKECPSRCAIVAAALLECGLLSMHTYSYRQV